MLCSIILNLSYHQHPNKCYSDSRPGRRIYWRENCKVML
ncbi:hypothetical protein NC652_023523 [Populus alba x Populus x berolinensis]|nr:hypothetical protein NC652_023523 [Populus alba x Populus x berolinensis]